MKIFKEEIEKIYSRLESGEQFAFSKYADGEWAIINNTPVTSVGEFTYSPDSRSDSNTRYRLLESYKFRSPGYYIGISCPCCQGMQVHKRMLLSSQQPIEQVTFANVFVNANYPYYVEKFIPHYANREVVLVCNEQGLVSNLPFKPAKVYGIKQNAFRENPDLVVEIKLDSMNRQGALYLFAAGPLGNLLAHQGWKTNDKNTYLDIGSTLNPWLQSEGHRRDYYVGKELGRQVCVWGE